MGFASWALGKLAGTDSDGVGEAGKDQKIIQSKDSTDAEKKAAAARARQRLLDKAKPTGVRNRTDE